MPTSSPHIQTLYAANGISLRASAVSHYSGRSTPELLSVKHVSCGAESYYLNGQHYEVCKNSYLICNAQHEAYVDINSTTPVLGLCVDISDAAMALFLKSLPDGYSVAELKAYASGRRFYVGNYTSYNTAIGRKLNELALHAAQFAQQPKMAQDLIVHDLVNDILLQQCEISEQFKGIHKKGYEVQSALFKKLLAVKSHIDSHYADDIDILNLATLAHLSPFHLIRHFKAAFSISPHQYILNKRLETACTYLKDGMMLTEVAYLCGFSSLSRFGKAFKSRYGVAPSIYQKK